MARVGRLAGAILAETQGDYFLIGNTKEPCDFAAHGFDPVDIDGHRRPYIRLSVTGKVEISSPCLTVDTEGELLAQLMAQRFLIERTGSVSERLWRLVCHPAGDEKLSAKDLEVSWLVRIPSPIWQVVRDAVLRCT